MDSIARLSQIGSPSLGGPICGGVNVPDVISPLVRAKNGFYAFEASLHVFPWGGMPGSAEQWNSPGLWLREYGDAAAGLTFFAEDAFGFQFAVGGDGIYSFDPEIAERELVASDIYEWASLILDDYEVQTGFSIMHEWQVRNGAIREGFRLAPSVPFFLGGKFDAQGMRAKESVELMRFRADIYRQVKDLPDGAQVVLRIKQEADE